MSKAIKTCKNKSQWRISTYIINTYDRFTWNSIFFFVFLSCFVRNVSQQLNCNSFYTSARHITLFVMWPWLDHHHTQYWLRWFWGLFLLFFQMISIYNYCPVHNPQAIRRLKVCRTVVWLLIDFRGLKWWIVERIKDFAQVWTKCVVQTRYLLSFIHCNYLRRHTVMARKQNERENNGQSNVAFMKKCAKKKKRNESFWRYEVVQKTTLDATEETHKKEPEWYTIIHLFLNKSFIQTTTLQTWQLRSKCFECD